MRLFLEISFRNLYYFLTRKAVRQFNRLAFQYGDAPRYSPRKIKVNGWELQVPDALSFIYQFREILVEESYLFNCTKTNPVIIDCGSNIGLSGIYFANRFKDAAIYCIEADQAIAQTLAGLPLISIFMLVTATYLHYLKHADLVPNNGHLQVMTTVLNIPF